MLFFHNEHETDKNQERSLDDDDEDMNSLFDIQVLKNLDQKEMKDDVSSHVSEDKKAVELPVHPPEITTVTVETKSPEVLTSDESPESITTTEPFDQRLKKEAKLAIVWYNKGVTLSKLGRYDEAIDAYDQALLINPNYSSAWNNKGVLLSKLGKYDEAIDAYDQALLIDSDYSALSEKPFISKPKVSIQI
jgi:tetratricopeptide (TPR) repeat protein